MLTSTRDLALVRLGIVHNAAEILEWSLVDEHLITDIELALVDMTLPPLLRAGPVSVSTSESGMVDGEVLPPTNPVILGVFITTCQVWSVRTIRTSMYPGKVLLFADFFLPWGAFGTCSEGTSMPEKNSSTWNALTLSSRDFFAFCS